MNRERVPKEMLKLVALAVGFSMFAACFAEDVTLPTDNQIAEAQERGKALRDQKKLLPEALMKYAAVMKIKGQRCGHEYVAIEDAHGDGGATYRYIERFKVSMPREQVEELDYTHVLLLNADLSLIGGKQVVSSKVAVDLKLRIERTTIDVQIVGDTFTLTRSEKIGDEAEKSFPPETTRLLGVRPIPGKAIVCMPAFTSKETKPLSGGTNPFMVSTMYMGWSKQAFNIQSAWLSFADFDPKKNDGVKLRMSARFLDSELSEKGLMVESPTAEIWAKMQTWGYDEKLRVIELPVVSDKLLSIERVDPDKLDFDSALDREKIRAALKEAEAQR